MIVDHCIFRGNTANRDIAIDSVTTKFTISNCDFESLPLSTYYDGSSNSIGLATSHDLCHINTKSCPNPGRVICLTPIASLSSFFQPSYFHSHSAQLTGSALVPVSAEYVNSLIRVTLSLDLSHAPWLVSFIGLSVPLLLTSDHKSSSFFDSLPIVARSDTSIESLLWPISALLKETLPFDISESLEESFSWSHRPLAPSLLILSVIPSINPFNYSLSSSSPEQFPSSSSVLTFSFACSPELISSSLQPVPVLPSPPSSILPEMNYDISSTTDSSAYSSSSVVLRNSLLIGAAILLVLIYVILAVIYAKLRRRSDHSHESSQEADIIESSSFPTSISPHDYINCLSDTTLSTNLYVE
jgi:hypothetical protein